MESLDFSLKAQRLLALAHKQADQCGASSICSGHLQLGALALGGSLKRILCSGSSLSLEGGRRLLKKRIAKGPLRRVYPPSTRSVLRAAYGIALSHHHKQVDAVHIIRLTTLWGD